MTAATRKIIGQEPGEIELLLPWHAAGTLNARDSRKVEEALARDPDLARQYAVIREEYAGTIDLNESLGAPSMRAMQKLFAAIDADRRSPETEIPWSELMRSGGWSCGRRFRRLTSQPAANLSRFPAKSGP